MAYRTAKAALLLLGCWLLASCGGDDDKRLSVSTQASPGGQLIPGHAQLSRNEGGQFQVVPESGYEIAHVEGCEGVLNDNLYVITRLPGDCTIRAEFKRKRYNVTTQVEGGQISPEEQTVSHGEKAQFELTPGEGFGWADTSTSGCGGERDGDTYTTGEIDGDCEVQINFGREVYSVSGRITPAAGTAVDNTLNDRTTLLIPNDGPDTAQAIANLVNLHGFVVFNEGNPGTGGNPNLEHFANENDEVDYFRASLQAGQVVRLTIADHNANAPATKDLDLWLFDDQEALIASSTGLDEAEEVTVPEDGDYYISIQASAGQARYVLQLLGPDASSKASQPVFVPNQVIVELVNQNTSQALSSGRSARRSAIDTASIRRGQASLVKIPPSPKKRVGLAIAGATVLRNPGDDLEVLRRRNPDSYRKVRTLREAKALSQQPDVAFAEPNYIVQRTGAPTDPLYERQWHYPAIDLPQAWDLLSAEPTGPVTVAVIDTGVFLNHPEFDGQLVPGYDFIADPNSAGDGDGIDNNPDDPGDSTKPGESSWHGTHVAGTIAAVSNNAQGVAGAAPDARLMPIRTLGTGGQGTTYDLIQGLLYAAGLDNDSGQVPNQRADIVNLSLGSSAYSQYAEQAFRQAREAGVIVVAAAGNSSTDAAFYPAAYDSVLSVGATDARRKRAPYSNFGSTLSLVAPGGDTTQDANYDGYPDGVLSTLAFKDADGTREPRYGYYNGTSMASPHVAGVIALMKSLHPDLSPLDVEKLLQSTEPGEMLTDDLGEPGRDNEFGYGQINALKAAQAALNLANGHTPNWPPLVEAQPDSLTLRSASQADVDLINKGGGTPTVVDVRADANWLSASALQVDAQGLGSYRISIDRTLLDTGYFSGEVIFTLDNGDDVILPVYVQEGLISGSAQTAPLYVLLLDANGDTIAYTKAYDENGEIAYQLEKAPPGVYQIYAGSDVDVDGVVCQIAESCGAYPLLELPQLITVDSDQTDLNFVTRLIGSSLSRTAPFKLQQTPPAKSLPGPREIR